VYKRQLLYLAIVNIIATDRWMLAEVSPSKLIIALSNGWGVLEDPVLS